MRRKIECCECEKALKKDEVALCKKLLGTDTEDYYCIDCLAEYLECTKNDLEIKIQEFKEQGCTLFLRWKEEPICWKIKYATFFPTWWC